MIRFIFLLSLVSSFGFSNVVLNAPPSFTKDEMYVFSIKASGSNITFPKIDKIDGNVVFNIGSASSKSISNGNIVRSKEISYSLLAKKEFTIPKMIFQIDGKEYTTSEKRIKAYIPKKTNSNLFDLAIGVNKNDSYVGEAIALKLIFKFRRDLQIVDLNFKAPSFDGFWYKQLEDSKKYSEGSFEVQELDFLLFPLKSGKLKINPISITASIVDTNRNFNSFFSTPTKNIQIYSNDLEFDIKALPKGINLIGDFNIESFLDKTQVKENEALSYKVKITGVGNIEDIKDINLDSLDGTIYENKAKIDTKYEDGLYKGVYIKTFSIVPNKDMTIPPIKLQYFHKDKNTVIEKYTKAFNIKILNQKNTNLAKLEKADRLVKEKIKTIEKHSTLDRVIFFILGIIFSILILGLYLYVIKLRENKKFDETPLIKRLKSAKDKDTLLRVLAIYINKDDNLDKLIFDLEKSDNINSIKKEIIKLLKTINLKGQK
jgi:hypothetical protein